MSVLSGLSTDIENLQKTISYMQAAAGGVVRGTIDTRTALDMSHIPAPATIVEYAGEDDSPLKPGGPLHLKGGSTTAEQFMRMQWDLFLVAANFGGRYDDAQTGMIDDADTGQKGIMTIIDDTFAACVGKTGASGTTKFFWGGVKRFSVSDAQVIYVVRLYCDVLRSN